MNIIPGVLMIAACLWHPVAARGDFRGLCDAYSKAEVFTPPTSLQGFQWMEGRWECVDRALTGSRSMDSYYAFLEAVIVDSWYIHLSESFPSGFTLYLDCEFTSYVRGVPKRYRTVLTEFNEEGFWFGIPSADVFTVKRDPTNPPSWFILEHTKSKDVLLFRRAKESSNKVETGTDKQAAPAVAPKEPEAKPKSGNTQ